MRPSRRWTRWKSRTRAPNEGALAADIALRIATLLRGGVPLGRVLPALAGEGHTREFVSEALERQAAGCTLAEAIAGADAPAWRVLAAALFIAERSGAPPASAMERIAQSLAAIESAAERRSVLLTGPRATITLVSALPLLAVAFGALLGFDPFAVLLGPAGAVVLPTGFTLLAAGVAWASALVRRIERSQQIAGVEPELAWIALQGGGPPGPALRLVADASSCFSAEWLRVDALVGDGVTRRVLLTAQDTGVAAGQLLLSEAAAERERALRALERAAERLGITILIPIGACVLPAFVVLGVLPVLLSMLGGPDGTGLAG